MRMTLVALTISCLFLAEAKGAVCNLTTTGVNFGAYDVFSTSPTDSTGSVTILCDATTTVATSIGQSPNSGGFNPRRMKHSSLGDLMIYNLYTDGSRTIIWGDGTGGTSTVTRKAIKNKPLDLTVYGRIPPGQDVSGGLYGETLVVTIVW